MKLHIYNGHILDPENQIDDVGDICVENDCIVSVLDKPDGFNADEEIDASGKLVTPGFVDICARFREPGQEHKATIVSESAATVAAGITTVCYPPDTQPAIDTSAVVELINQRTASDNRVRIYPLGALTQNLDGNHLADMHTLIDAGCIGVSNASQNIENTEVFRRALEYAASFNITVFIHAEDLYLRNNGVMHEGAMSTRLGLPPIPETAETVAISKVLLLAEQTGARIHFCRLSSAKSLSMIADAKNTGLLVSADAGICYLHLTDTDIESYDTNFFILPPLRSEVDKQALRQGIKNGSIDCICSDHQPHDDDAKAAPFSLAKPGASTVEMLFPLINELVSDNTLSLTEAVAAITSKPAHILGLELGTLGVGSKADISIIDQQLSWQVEKEHLLSFGKNTPFDGRKLSGKVTYTIMNGNVVFKI